MSNPPLDLCCDTLNICIGLEDRALIDRASRLTGRTTAGFVLEAARRAAEDAVVDPTLRVLCPTALRARLAEPPRPSDRLRRSLQTPAPWE
jgi:uncharacterized protein (DUF1778 family)